MKVSCTVGGSILGLLKRNQTGGSNEDDVDGGGDDGLLVRGFAMIFFS